MLNEGLREEDSIFVMSCVSIVPVESLKSLFWVQPFVNLEASAAVVRLHVAMEEVEEKTASISKGTAHWDDTHLKSNKIEYLLNID